MKDKYKIAVLLVEHDMQVVMGMCQRIAVLDYGIKIAEAAARWKCTATPKSLRPTWAIKGQLKIRKAK